MLHTLFQFLMQEKTHCYGHWDSIVSVATLYRMGSLGFEPHWGSKCSVPIQYGMYSIIHMYN